MTRAHALILGLVLTAAPALAQQGGGSPQMQPSSPYPPMSRPNLPGFAAPSHDALAVEALHNYAVCAVQRTPDGAVKLLNTNRSLPTFNREVFRFAKGHASCGGRATRLAFGDLPFQGDIAEAVIAQRFGDRSLSAAAPAEAIKPNGEPEAMGMCIVRAKPDATSALLRSKPGSEDEHAALNQTVDVLSSCVPKGMTMKMNRPAARAIIALGAYRLLAGNPNPAES